MDKIKTRSIIGLVFVAIGAALSLPAEQSGRVLFIPVHGHGLHVTDVIGLVPFALGLALIAAALLARRSAISNAARARPLVLAGVVLAFGLGAGFLGPEIAPSLPWWAAAVALLSGALVAIVAIATKNE